MHFTYILNIDIDVDIAIFCKYRIDIVSKLKKWHGSITNTEAHDVIARRTDNISASQAD